MADIIGIIPARYGSTRFPGKALADLGGKSMIQRVYEQASRALSRVIVATDDSRIFDHVSSFGKAIMTSESCQSGTDRCAEAISLISEDFSYVINIQGDEPFIDPDEIGKIVEFLNTSNDEIEIVTLASPFSSDSDPNDPNIVKVVFDINGSALYFSRSKIPFERADVGFPFFQHIGLYAYRKDILLEVSNLKPTKLELSESLEQLRWLENGYNIRVMESRTKSLGIDTPEELENAINQKLWQVN